MFKMESGKMYKPLNNETSLLYKYVNIFLVVSAYWVISILTVFVNKALLSSTAVNLDAPLFVTWFQCLVSAIICILMSFLSKCFPNRICFPQGNPLNWTTFCKVIPLSILFTSMIATNNLCLKYVSVAFYFIGRSLTTVFNVILTFLLLKQTTSLKSIFCCALIIFGFCLGVDQESLSESFSWRGTMYGILGSLSVSFYSIYTKKTLPHVNQEIWLLSYYNNFYSSVLFLPLILVSGEFKEVLNYENIDKSWFWVALIIGGACGFSIGYVTALQIKVTSPLTHNISGTAKACAQTIMATQWYHESKSLLWWASNGVVLFGSAAYARVKQLEMEEQHKKNSLSRRV